MGNEVPFKSHVGLSKWLGLPRIEPLLANDRGLITGVENLLKIGGVEAEV